MNAQEFDAIFDEALAIAGGSQMKLAVAAGVSQNAIWSAKRSRRFSAELALKIEKATNGAVPRWRLRPDLWAAPAEQVSA